MKKYFLFPFLGLLIIMMMNMCTNPNEAFRVKSPDENLTATVFLDNGKLFYRLQKGDILLIDTSRLGFRMSKMPNLNGSFEVKETLRTTRNETWIQPWGEEKEISDHHNELKVRLFNKQDQVYLTLVFRMYDDGMGFRYEIPSHEQFDSVYILDELTEFNFTEDNEAWWIPGDPDSYEYLYTHSPVSTIDSANTPVTLKTSDETHLSIHEAALTNYAGMRLLTNPSHANGLKCDLIPWPDGIKVKGKLPLVSPWRTIQVGANAGDLVESHLILNLNEPNQLDDISYVQPMKYVGIWWGMHIDVNTWYEGPRHGATTPETKRYIDFASKHGIKGVLVEGWNKGWESWLSGNNVQDYTQPADDFNIEELTEYAKKKGLSLIGHHESGGNIPMYEKQMEDAFEYYNKLGIHAVKTGYAGQMKPKGLFHHSQPMVEHYRKVLELAHQHQIMIDAHEPIKPTGIRRTFPNMMTREGVRGMEYNAWSKGNPPSHTTILPFTRMLAGPLDYTPGIFDILLEKHKEIRRKHAGENFNRRVHSTLAKQLGLFVVLYSPMQMASDLVENYETHPAFQFIEDVPADWEKTRVLNGEIGKYVTIVRKDRNSEEWYLGSLTNEKQRSLTVPLNFLK